MPVKHQSMPYPPPDEAPSAQDRRRTGGSGRKIEPGAEPVHAHISGQFIGEAIQPEVNTIDTSRMAVGGSGLPQVFHWKTQTLRLARVLRCWHETGPCHHGSGEAYVRKHWFEVVTDNGQILKLYFERQSRSGKNRSRWWLFSIGQNRQANGEGGALSRNADNRDRAALVFHDLAGNRQSKAGAASLAKRDKRLK